jgi:hypothetical protein
MFKIRFFFNVAWQVYLDSEIGDDATGTMQAPIAFSCDADETQSGPQHRSVAKMPVAT